MFRFGTKPLTLGEKIDSKLTQLGEYFVKLERIKDFEKQETERAAVGRDFVLMGEEILGMAVAKGAIDQATKQIASGLIQIGLSLVTPGNIASLSVGIFQVAMGVFSLFDSDEEGISAHQQIM